MAWHKGFRAPSGMPASGAGWGGEAKGAHSVRTTPAGFPKRKRDEGGCFVTGLTDRGILRKERSEKLEDRLFDVAMAKSAEEAQPVQVQAAAKLHAIYNGDPTKRVENTGKDGGPIEVAAATERASAAADIIARRLTPIAPPGDPDG